MKWFQGAGTPKLLLVKTLIFLGLAVIIFEGLEVPKWTMRPKWFWNIRTLYVWTIQKKRFWEMIFGYLLLPQKKYQGRGDINIYIYSENMEYSTTWHWTLTLLPKKLKHRNRVPWGVEAASTYVTSEWKCWGHWKKKVTIHWYQFWRNPHPSTRILCHIIQRLEPVNT